MGNKPLVSFLMFAYEQEQYVRDAVKGALAQTYEPLEIFLSDDCSPDRTFEIIKEEARDYHGPHRLLLNQNKKNLGLSGHINHVVQKAKGDFLVMAAGDDISLPERTDLLVNRWLDKNKPVDLVCSFFEEINVEGKSTNFIKTDTVFTPDITLPVEKWRCGATGACAGYSKLIFDKYGPLDEHIIAEDWVLSFRAWIESDIGIIEKPLVRHRTHNNCISVISKNIKTEKNAEKRRLLRKNYSCDKLARAKEWLSAWQLSGRFKEDRIESDLKKWIELLEIERQAYESGPLQALKYAMQSTKYRYGLKSMLHLIVRNVLGFY